MPSAVMSGVLSSWAVTSPSSPTYCLMLCKRSVGPAAEELGQPLLEVQLETSEHIDWAEMGLVLWSSPHLLVFSVEVSVVPRAVL